MAYVVTVPVGSKHASAGSMEEDLSQVVVTSLAAASQLRLAAGRVLLSPIQAANSLPLLKAAPLPIAATIAVATAESTKDLGDLVHVA